MANRICLHEIIGYDCNKHLNDIINVSVVSREYDTIKASAKGKLISKKDIMFPNGMIMIIEE